MSSIKETKDTMREMQELLTVCLAKAIDIALTSLEGNDWFTTFRAEEKEKHKKWNSKEDKGASKTEKPVLDFTKSENGPESIYHCDFQALLKILAFSSKQQDVFAYYGLSLMDEIGKTENNRLKYLLLRLISDFRNGEAHKSADEIKKELSGQTQITVYGPQQAINDMLTLGNIFESVTDENGDSYYRQMKELFTQYLLRQSACLCYIEEIIKNEHLDADTLAVVGACNELRIDVQTIDGQFCFTTTEYVKDIARIKERLSLAKSTVDQVPPAAPSAPPQSEERKGGRSVVPSLLGAALLIAVIALIIVTIRGCGRSPSEGNNDAPVLATTGATSTSLADTTTKATVTTTSSETTVTTTEETTVTTTIGTTATPSNWMKGEITYEGLTLRVDQEISSSLTFHFENRENFFSFGWVANSIVVLTTDEGIYATETPEIHRDNYQIGAGDDGSFTVHFDKEIKGVPQKITIDSVYVLDGNLPSGRAKTLTIVLS